VTFHNLLKNDVRVDKKRFLNAVDARKPIGITYEGEIFEGEHGSLPPKPYIFAGTPKSLVGSAAEKPTPLAKVLGDNYEVSDEGDKIRIYAGRAWQEMLAANEPFHLYQDTTSDGITEFTDAYIDDLIWYSCEFGINAREVAQHLEETVEGTLLCIENERPYSFTACAYVDDIEEARKKAFDFIRDTLKSRIESGEIALDDLEDAEEEALRFFGLL
jgi:hypothetical protein